MCFSAPPEGNAATSMIVILLYCFSDTLLHPAITDRTDYESDSVTLRFANGWNCNFFLFSESNIHATCMTIATCVWGVWTPKWQNFWCCYTFQVHFFTAETFTYSSSCRCWRGHKCTDIILIAFIVFRLNRGVESSTRDRFAFKTCSDLSIVSCLHSLRCVKTWFHCGL